MNTSIANTASRRVAMAVAGIAALTALSVNAQQSPANDAEVPTHVVKYEDLDLSVREDAQALYRRLQSAAEEVCNVYAEPRPTKLNKIDAQCKREAVAKAVANVDHPGLTALHMERGGMKLARVKSQSTGKASLASKSVGVPAASGG